MAKQIWLILGASSDLCLSLLGQLDEISPPNEIVIYAQYNSHPIEVKMRNITLINIQADLSKREQVENLLEQIGSVRDEITHLLHFAALPFEYMKVAKWDAARTEKNMEVCAFSFARVCADVLPAMARKRSGKVLAVLTDYVEKDIPPKFMVDYVMSKYALKGYVKSLRAEYEEKGIDIYTISPTMMETKFINSIDKRIVDMDAEKMPEGRHISIESVANNIIMMLKEVN